MDPQVRIRSSTHTPAVLGPGCLAMYRPALTHLVGVRAVTGAPARNLRTSSASVADEVYLRDGIFSVALRMMASKSFLSTRLTSQGRLGSCSRTIRAAATMDCPT